jgi:predicted amidohydrolase YtcJ
MTGDPVTDLVVRNARVCTLDQAHPWAGAVAVRAGRVSWVGDDSDADDHVGPGTQVIDAGGRLVLPGFIDSHNHVRLGSDADCVQLGGAGSLDQVRARVAAWLGEHRDAEWVEGEGLDYPALRPGPADLDGVAGARPVFLFDGRQPGLAGGVRGGQAPLRRHPAPGGPGQALHRRFDRLAHGGTVRALRR